MKKTTAGIVLLSCLAFRATADIVWSGEQNLIDFSVPIDLNSDSLTDITMSYWITSSDQYPVTGYVGMLDAFVGQLSQMPSNLILVDASNGADAALSYGTLISGTPDSALEWAGGSYFAGSVSDWSTTSATNPDEEWNGLLGETGDVYLGIAFEVEDATHYGWINITLGEEDPNLGFKTPIIASWAYETEADTAIIAGAIPEPSTGILTMVGSLSLLFIARSRRRTQPLTARSRSW